MGAEHSYASDLLNTAQTLFFNPEDQTRVSIECEFTGLSPEKAAIFVQKILGGTIEQRAFQIKTSLKKIESDGSRIYNSLDLHEFIVHTPMGEIALKPETNQVTNVDAFEENSQIVELVSDPIRFPQVLQLQKVLTRLQVLGAQGTSESRAVSMQVNVEIDAGDLEKTPKNIQPVIELFRSYARPEHRKQIDARLKVPENRRPYVEGPSKGF